MEWYGIEGVDTIRRHGKFLVSRYRLTVFGISRRSQRLEVGTNSPG